MLVFRGGGMLAALFGPGRVVVAGLAGPDVLAYPRLPAFAQHLVGKAFLFAVIMLFAWHAAPRILCRLHDVDIHKGLAAKTVCYGAALVVTLVAAGALASVGF